MLDCKLWWVADANRNLEMERGKYGKREKKRQGVKSAGEKL